MLFVLWERGQPLVGAGLTRGDEAGGDAAAVGDFDGDEAAGVGLRGEAVDDPLVADVVVVDERDDEAGAGGRGDGVEVVAERVAGVGVFAAGVNGEAAFAVDGVTATPGRTPRRRRRRGSGSGGRR